MYTVCYTKNGQDYWTRCESRREVAAFLIREGLQDESEDNILIFSPDAEDCMLSIEDVFASI